MNFDTPHKIIAVLNWDLLKTDKWEVATPFGNFLYIIIIDVVLFVYEYYKVLNAGLFVYLKLDTSVKVLQGMIECPQL